MGRVLEHNAKALLASFGVPVPDGATAGSLEEARQVIAAIGEPVVVKALVPAGKRGKSGAIRVAETDEQAETAVAALLRTVVGGYPAEQVLIERRISIQRELYLSIGINRDLGRIRVMVNGSGGIDIEETVREQPESLISLDVKPSEELHEFRAREMWSKAGISGPVLPRLGNITHGLLSAFRQLDAYLLEINPLAVTFDGDVVAVGTVLAIDDAALYRHRDMQNSVQAGSEKVWRPLTEREQQVNDINAAEPYRGSARYLELEGGDIGFLCGGGGASLVLFDSLVHTGGKPANYSEFGGNPTETKVAGLTRVVLSKPGVRGLFVAHNITNNTQVDVVARGVVRGLDDAGVSASDIPVVAREIGVHDEEGKIIFESAGIHYFGEESTLSDAAREMVRFMDQQVKGNVR